MTEFQKWLLQNEAKLKTYTAQEIYNLAIACGFDHQELERWLTNRIFKAA